VKVTVRARNGACAFDCDPGEKILYAGLRQGLGLPYECGSGTCGTCRARLIEGDIADPWPEAPGRSFLKDPGEFLMCQCTARGDLALQVASAVESLADDGCRPRHLSGVVRGRRPLAPDVLGVDLEVAPPLAFEAGQFVLLQAPGISGHRGYSMVNFDRPASRLAFVVKRKPGGSVSEWLFAPEAEGARVSVFGPLGRATFAPDLGQPILCVAGGSGIAGMMSILARAAGARHFDRYPGDVFFGVRTLADLFLAEELAGLRRRFPDTLRVTVALSDAAVPASARDDHPELAFDTGLVHEVTTRAMRGRFGGVRAYVAGPPPMVDASIRMLLKDGRLSPRDIRYDKFS
jgi:toluene monooxygenase electron transfer component